MKCEECKIEFTPIRVTQRLCGRRACKNSKKRKLQKLQRDEDKAKVAELTEPIPCPVCGDMFIPSGRQLVTCSTPCSKLNTNQKKSKGGGSVVIPQEYLVRGLIGVESRSSQISNGGGE